MTAVLTIARTSLKRLVADRANVFFQFDERRTFTAVESFTPKFNGNRRRVAIEVG